jgi:hypothetical protein
MDLAVVFHLPLPGGRIQAGKLVSPRKDPPSRGRACVGLLGKVCTGAPDRPPGATYYAQTADDSAWWYHPCHTPFRERGNEASIRVPRMFKSHAWQQYDKQMQHYE